MNWRADDKLFIFNCCCHNFICNISKNYDYIGRTIMAGIDWKQKHYEAHDRLSRKKGWDFSDNNPYFERMMIVLPDPKIKTKPQMKKELKKHGYK